MVVGLARPAGGIQAVAPSSSSTTGPVTESSPPAHVDARRGADLRRSHRDELEPAVAVRVAVPRLVRLVEALVRAPARAAP